jgi:hypothetical protein
MSRKITKEIVREIDPGGGESDHVIGRIVIEISDLDGDRIKEILREIIERLPPHPEPHA